MPLKISEQTELINNRDYPKPGKFILRRIKGNKLNERWSCWTFSLLLLLYTERVSLTRGLPLTITKRFNFNSLKTIKTIRPREHEFKSREITKTNLSCFDNKRFVLGDGRNNLPYILFQLTMCKMETELRP